MPAADGRTRAAAAGSGISSRLADIDAELGAAALPAAPITARRPRLAALDTAAALALLLRLAAAGTTIARLRRKREPRARDRGGARAHGRRRAGGAARGRRPLAALGYAAVQARLGAALPPRLPRPRGRRRSARWRAIPPRLRWKELAAQFQHVCLEAIPVVVLVTFLIGMVLAYLFGMQAEKYGANIFVVDAVGDRHVARDRRRCWSRSSSPAGRARRSPRSSARCA